MNERFWDYVTAMVLLGLQVSFEHDGQAEYSSRYRCAIVSTTIEAEGYGGNQLAAAMQAMQAYADAELTLSLEAGGA